MAAVAPLKFLLEGSVYTIDLEIGRGAHAFAYRAVRASDAQQVVVKYFGSGSRGRHNAAREAANYRALADRCPRVARLIAGPVEIKVPAFKRPASIIIVELVRGITLHDFLRFRRWPETVDARLLLSISLELARGLQELYDADFAHMDLKPDNVMVTFDSQGGSVDVSVKIIDLGNAISLEQKGREVRINPLKGYHPREVFARAVELDRLRLVDLWSAGKIIMDMLTGTDSLADPCSFHTLPLQQVRARINSGVKSLDVLLASMLHPSLEERITPPQLVRALEAHLAKATVQRYQLEIFSPVVKRLYPGQVCSLPALTKRKLGSKTNPASKRRRKS